MMYPVFDPIACEFIGVFTNRKTAISAAKRYPYAHIGMISRLDKAIEPEVYSTNNQTTED